MVARADILAGRAVILINIQDTIDAQLRSIRNKIRTFSNGLNEIGGDLFRGGIAGTVGSIFPVKEFVDFQDQMLFLQTKAQATEKQMRSLERVIRSLGMTTSFSSTEVAKGATMLAQAGFQPSAIEASLQAVLDLARGSRIELETSSTILSNILSAYQLDPGRASEVASKLIATARLGTLDVVDIGESMKELMTTARQLNLPLEDTLGMIAQISNMSLRATKAGTSLNAAWANLSAKGEQLAELGITITDSDLENPIQVFAKLSEALRRLPRQQQVQTLQSLFAIRGGRGFGAVLMQDLDELERKIRIIKTAGDEARISAEKLDSQLGGVGRRAFSAFQELMLAIGGTSEGPLTVFGENLAKVFNNMSRLATANPKFVQGLLLIGPASLAAGAGLLTLTMIGGKLAMLITPLMMLNAAIFKTAAAIVGVNKRSLYGIYYALARPYVTAMTAVDKYNQAVNKASEAQAAYMLGPSEKGLKKAQNTAKAAANMAKKLPFFLRQDSIFQRELRFATALEAVVARVTKLWSSLPGMQGSPIRVPGDNFPGRQGRGPVSAFGYVPRLGYDPSISMRRDLPEAASNVAQTQRLLGRSVAGFLPDLRRSISTSVFRGFTHQDVVQRRLENQRGFQMVQPIQRLLEDNRRGLMAGRMPNINRGAIIDGRVLSGSAQPVLSSWGKAGKAVREAVLWVGRFIRSVSSGAFIGLAKIIQGIGVGFRGLWAGIRTAGRGIASVNWLRVIITSTTTVLKILRGIFTLLNNIRRFVFSLSGALLIVEALIIFGDKIPGINQLLAGAGKALSALFKDLGHTLANLSPSLQLVGRGLRDIFTGESERGVSRLKAAFNDITEIIKTGWTTAWGNFMQNIEPAAQRLKIVFEGVVGTVKVLVASIGAALGTVFQSGGLLIKGDGTLLETIKSAFSTENIKAFFVGVIAFVGEIGLRLNSMLGMVAEALNSMKQTFIAMLKSLTWIKGSGAQQALNELDSNYIARKSLQTAINNINRGIMDGSLKGRVKEQLAIRDQFQAELDKLPPAFSSFTYNVEAGAKSIKDAMEAATESISNAGQPATLQEYGPGNAAGIAAFEARMNLMADTFGASFFGQGANSLGGLLANWFGGVGHSSNGLANLLSGPQDMSGYLALIKNNQAEIERLRFLASEEEDPSAINRRIQVLETGIKIAMDYLNKQRGMEQSVRSLLTNPPTLESLRTQMDGLVAGFKEAFLGIKPDLKEQEDQIANVASSVGKALVGDFASTRGSTLQVVPRLEKLQEKANKINEDIAANTRRIADQGPLVFTA